MFGHKKHDKDAGSSAPVLPPGFKGGSTYQYATEDQGVKNTWCNGTGTYFNVRKEGYAKHKHKEHSVESMYELVAMDLIRPKARVNHVAAQAELPPPRECDDLEAIAKCGLPRIFIVNCQVPHQAPGLFGGGKDDPGYSMIFYFSIKPETVQALLAPDQAPEGTPHKAIALLRRFCQEWSTNEDIRRRFKVIGMIDKFEEKGAALQLLSPYNGKPVIIYKTGAIFAQGADYIEIDIKIHEFAYFALQIFDNFKHQAPDFELRAAFLIQGEDDSELPEVVMGAAEVHRVELEKATVLK